MKKIVVATQNKGKVKEIKEILADLPVEVKTMGEVGIDIDIEENGTTFEENAKIKAVAQWPKHRAVITKSRPAEGTLTVTKIAAQPSDVTTTPALPR